jgi:hypothetical protein
MKSGVKEEHVDNYPNDFFFPVLSLISGNKDSAAKSSELKSLGKSYREKHQGESFVWRWKTSEKKHPHFHESIGYGMVCRLSKNRSDRILGKSRK